HIRLISLLLISPSWLPRLPEEPAICDLSKASAYLTSREYSPGPTALCCSAILNGQFVLGIDGSQHTPDELFEQAQLAEENADIAGAERLYRILMKRCPTAPSAPFNLGTLFRAVARNVEAETALRAATRADPTFVEAWYNLSDLLDEQGRSEAAIECLRTALQVAPDYADAIFNLALLLQRKNEYAEAADYWRRDLANDCQSEWAARARRSLKFCEMQIHLIASA